MSASVSLNYKAIAKRLSYKLAFGFGSLLAFSGSLYNYRQYQAEMEKNERTKQDILNENYIPIRGFLFPDVKAEMQSFTHGRTTMTTKNGMAKSSKSGESSAHTDSSSAETKMGRKGSWSWLHSWQPTNLCRELSETSTRGFTNSPSWWISAGCLRTPLPSSKTKKPQFLLWFKLRLPRNPITITSGTTMILTPTSIWT